jgi:hypothetical protein
MPSGYTVNGTDLDDKFMARSGSAGGATNYSVSGTDLNARYEPRGSTAKIGDVGYSASGSDISNAFMEKHDCFTYSIYYGPGGNATASWTTCYGGSATQDNDTNDSGYYGSLAFTTTCAWEGTVSLGSDATSAQDSACS